MLIALEKDILVPRWAIQLRSADPEPLAALWNLAGAQACRQADCVWLLMNELEDEWVRRLATIPCDGIFQILPGGELLREGSRVPRGYLPAGPWQPLREFLTVVLPVASLAPHVISRIPIRLVPATQSANLDSLEPDVLITEFDSWARYAANAPQIRLATCLFAVARDGRVLISGKPLPPLSGVRAVARAGLVIPCGWQLVPAVEPALLARAWGISDGDLCILSPGQPIECLRARQLVRGSRAAIRETQEALRHVRTE